jgi:hypothetical protein
MQISFNLHRTVPNEYDFLMKPASPGSTLHGLIYEFCRAAKSAQPSSVSQIMHFFASEVQSRDMTPSNGSAF